METKLPKDYGLDVSNIYDKGSTRHEIESPFSLNAEDFLEYSEEDIKENNNKNIINSLSNVKRSIENRVDLLLYAFGCKFSKQLRFPEKLNELNKMGIIAPRILKKINKIRNLLEHQYEIPNKEKVEDALDVAILFIEYTNKFIYEFTDYFDGKCNDKLFRIKMKKGMIEINIVGVENLCFNCKDSGFYEWITFYVECAY